MLILKNSRPDFKSLFKEHLNKFYASYNPYCYGYNDYGYYDDDYSELFHGCTGTLFGDDEDDVYYNGYSKHFGVGINHNKRKRGCRGGSRKKSSKNRSKCIPLYSNGNYDDYDDDDIVYPLKYNKNSKCNSSSSSSKNVRYSDNEDNLFSSFDDNKKIYYYSDMNNPDDNVSTFYSVFDFDRFLDEEGISVNESDIQSLLNRSVSHCCINPFVKDRLELMTDSSFGGLHYQYAENNDDLLAAEDVLAHSSSVKN